MGPQAAYDEIADWYETEFLAGQRAGSHLRDYADSLGIDQALVELLGPGHGRCLEIGCGTGIYAERVGALGWEPIGIDISGAMLAHSVERLPAAQSDALSLPFASDRFPAVLAVMVHTDMTDYEAVLTEIHRVLAPGGIFVHIGVHPCFCGGFADRTDPEHIIINRGYLDGQWTTESWTDQGLRDKVGAGHFPLAALLNAVLSQGFTLDAFSEGAEPTPVVLSFRATKSVTPT